jgi:hypothetical protein
MEPLLSSFSAISNDSETIEEATGDPIMLESVIAKEMLHRKAKDKTLSL